MDAIVIHEAWIYLSSRIEIQTTSNKIINETHQSQSSSSIINDVSIIEDESTIKHKST